jgi:hypothetical protein
MRNNFRLTEKDADIAAMFEAMRPSDIVRCVVRAYIRDERFILPTAPAVNISGTATYHIRLDDIRDRDVCEWLNNVKRGQISNVLRILLRRAMDQPNINQYFSDSAEANISIPATSLPATRTQTRTMPRAQMKERADWAKQLPWAKKEAHNAPKTDAILRETRADESASYNSKTEGQIDPLSII